MRRPLLAVLLLLACASAIGFAGSFQNAPEANVAAVATFQTPEENSDVYVRFVLEGFDIIQKNYWQKATDPELVSLFQLSLNKAASTSTPPVSDRKGLAKQLGVTFAGLENDEKKREVATLILQVALYNLAPAGRSQLLSAQEQKAVQETVANINPNSDLYGELGVTASSTDEQIQHAYATRKEELQASTSPAAKEALQRADYVHNVLTDSTSKQRYDSNKAEPTVFAHVFGTTLYLNVARMSPETAGDFIAALNAASSTPLSSLIVDVRNNIGGSLEQVPNMIGIFMGVNQYEFDLFHQADFQPIRSPIDRIAELNRFKEMVLLTNGQTQSSAEVLTAALKRFKLATVVGTHTRGWGTVENTYPITAEIDPSTRYAILLVWGLTLRDDNQPIDGRGVDPDISIEEKNWEQLLAQRLRSPSLISAVKATVTKDPLK